VPFPENVAVSAAPSDVLLGRQLLLLSLECVAPTGVGVIQFNKATNRTKLVGIRKIENAEIILQTLLAVR
jgi:hypothetical protein